jgi:predicted nucleic-acid-binding protein
VVVRHLIQDDEKYTRAAKKLFEACDRGELTLVLLPLVLAECIFVLESFYGRSRGEIAAALAKVITGPGLEIDEPTIHLAALDRYKRTSAHFVDCTIAAKAVANGVSVATFDQDFRKFGDVRVETD